MLKGVRLELLMGPLTFSAPPREVTEALIEAQVTHAAGQRSGFQLKFRLAKGSRMQRELLPGGFFDPPTRVVLVVLVDGVPHVLSDGVIARHDVSVSSEAGGTTLTVTGSDVSQMMDQIDLSGVPMPAMPHPVQVLFLLARWAAYGIVPLVMPTPLMFVPVPTQRIPSQQGTDYAHINSLADKSGFVFYVEPGPTPGMNTAYWGPEIRVGQPQPALTVNSDAATNVDSMSFSFDGLRKAVYLLWVNLPEVHVSFPVPVPDIGVLNPPLGPNIIAPRGEKQLNRAERPRSDDSTAKYSMVETAMRGLARASQAANVVTASGTLDVARYGRLLEARKLVAVRGAGPQFDGSWFVRSVTTTMKPGSINQSFSLDRNALGSFGNTVPVAN